MSAREQRTGFTHACGRNADGKFHKRNPPRGRSGCWPRNNARDWIAIADCSGEATHRRQDSNHMHEGGTGASIQATAGRPRLLLFESLTISSDAKCVAQRSICVALDSIPLRLPLLLPSLCGEHSGTAETERT
jgi:hypothetical protein